MVCTPWCLASNPAPGLSLVHRFPDMHPKNNVPSRSFSSLSKPTVLFPLLVVARALHTVQAVWPVPGRNRYLAIRRQIRSTVNCSSRRCHASVSHDDRQRYVLQLHRWESAGLPLPFVSTEDGTPLLRYDGTQGRRKNVPSIPRRGCLRTD